MMKKENIMKINKIILKTQNKYNNNMKLIKKLYLKSLNKKTYFKIQIKTSTKYKLVNSNLKVPKV